MIEAVVGLLMFVNGEIKEHVCKVRWLNVYAGSVRLRDSIQKLYPTNAGRVELEDNIDGSKSIKKLIIE